MWRSNHAAGPILMTTTYKDEHESFVSNGIGTSVACIFICLAHAPALVYLLKICQHNTGPRLIRDMFFMTLTALLTLTLFAEVNHWTALCLYIIVGIHLYSNKYVVVNAPMSDSSMGPSAVLHAATNHITLYKGLNVLLTCISILAVDFKIFPRNFAKTETFGMSLMDIGVGTFMIASALTSRYARGVPSASAAFTLATLQSVSLQHLLVLMLGVGRFVALKVLNYQEHVSEYGVHWNFFVTLFCVWTVSDFVHRTLPRWSVIWVALLCLMSYQAVLLWTPLTDFIFSSTRTDLVSANKEGVCSLMGYIPMFLLSEAIAHNIFHSSNSGLEGAVSEGEAKKVRKPSTPDVMVGAFDSAVNSKNNELFNSTGNGNGYTTIKWDFTMMRKMAVSSITLWLAWLAATTVQPTSRRLVNIPYVSLILALTMTILFMLYVSDMLTGGPSIPVLTLQYLSKHSLLVFLAANVLTGVVNMSMQTIYASRTVAYVVLLLYSVAVTCVAWLAEHFTATKADKVRV